MVHSLRQAQDRALIAAQNVTWLLERDLAGWFDKIDLTLAAVQEEAERQLAVGGIDPSRLDPFIVRQRDRQPTLEDLGVASADGSVTMGTGIGSAPLNISQRPYFIRLRDVPNAGLVISAPFQRYRNGEKIIALARRVNRPNGDFAGVVVGLIALDQFERHFAFVNLGSEGQVVMRSLDHVTVARFPQSEPRGDAAGEDWMTAETDSVEGSYVTASPAGRARTVAYRKVGQYPFTITVGLLSEDAMAQWRLYAGGIAALLVLCILISGLSAWQIARFWRARDAATKKLELSNLALQKSEEYLSLALESAGLGVWELDRATGRLIADAQARRLHALPAEGPLDPDLVLAAIHPDDRANFHYSFERTLQVGGPFEFQYRSVHAGDTCRWLSLRGRSQSAPETSTGWRIIGVIQDITERKVAEAEIHNLAFYDALTGLPNRRLLFDRLKVALASRARSGRGGALLFVDLDNFKMLNDTCGHEIGDSLLKQVAQRLAGCVREADTVARLGGDEFLIVLEDLSKTPAEAAEQTKVVGERILASLNQPYRFLAHVQRNTPSIGATLFNDSRYSIDDLIAQADLAMYQAKKAGRNTIRFFENIVAGQG